jgi:large conductance mechanosensitive channel
MSIREHFKGFMHFIRTQGVAGFAIGFILGQATSSLVGSFVSDIVNPAIGLFLTDFSSLATLSYTIRGSTFNYGHFISLVINFFILAAIAYFGINKLVDVFDAPKDVPPKN